MKNKETLEEAAERIYREYPNNPLDKPDWRYNRDVNCFKKRKAFIAGAKWQAERMFDIMQQYAAFCVKCDREKLPLLFAKEWFEQFKKK
jgi:hypothetical protein